jgi:N-acetylglucosamine kinase-like BadF-type ATPase
MAWRAVIGIDGGGTATRVLILDERGGELARAEGGAALIDWPGTPIDIETVAATVGRAATAAGIELPAAALCAGFAGVGREPERGAVEQALAGRLAERARVITDAEAAFFDAFADGPGLLLIAGTGSMGLGRAEDGREARTGGWGLLLGDEGSGYDIGLSGLRAAVRAADGRGEATELLPRLVAELGLVQPEELIPWASMAPKTAFAALAPSVCELAAAGDALAAEIVASAVASLVAHVDALLSRLGPWSAPPGLALAGGLLAPGGPLRGALVAALAEHACVVFEREVEAVRGAARLALRDLAGR